MIRMTLAVFAISVAVFTVLHPISNSMAQQCTSSGDCKMPLTCQPGFFGGYCAVQYCNADTDCRNGSICDFGVCQTACRRSSDCDRGQVCALGQEGRFICTSPPPSFNGSSGDGGGFTHYYTEGGICGTIRLGGPHSTHIKHIGCAPGLQCAGAAARGTGICQRLQP